LPDAERRHAARIRSQPRRDEFVATRMLLRGLLAARLGQPPGAVPILGESDGRLRVADGAVEVSLSHSGGWCAVALSADCAVGVDVEPVRPVAGLAEVARQFFPAAGQADFFAAAPDRRLQVFFRWWTRVEAAVKACGRGIDDARWCFERVAFESCEAMPGVAAAVAARTECPLGVEWHVH